MGAGRAAADALKEFLYVEDIDKADVALGAIHAAPNHHAAELTRRLVVDGGAADPGDAAEGRCRKFGFCLAQYRVVGRHRGVHIFELAIADDDIAPALVGMNVCRLLLQDAIDRKRMSGLTGAHGQLVHVVGAAHEEIVSRALVELDDA